ncbi:hypothetical protein [Massilia sp. Se16.2.3]|uniref:hypothetical protein n=1 Tax=Massilia sp. Se16.2.3 TaxID=2709303 RepID=UPI0015FEBD62|nr:hypothetical protein [Massilia sp. Se16.2.3]QNB00110.1 hypothetical protein G4G31_16945 [Massilia sp. Se16.2.3]
MALPVALRVGPGYLCLSRAQYDTLYAAPLSAARLRELYGFPAEMAGRLDWRSVAVVLPEFLRRTGLAYCDFLALWRSGHVLFENGASRQDGNTHPDEHADAHGFPHCPPCCADDYVLHFPEASSVDDALARLAVFIRLWRSLHCLPGAGYGFAELSDICAVLGLTAGGKPNPGFIAQLAAFQILRDDWSLALGVDDTAPDGASAADRTRLLGLWPAPGTRPSAGRSTTCWRGSKTVPNASTPRGGARAASRATGRRNS